MPRFRLKALMLVIALVALMLAFVNHTRRAALQRVQNEAQVAYYQALYAAQQKAQLRQAQVAKARQALSQTRPSEPAKEGGR